MLRRLPTGGGFIRTFLFLEISECWAERSLSKRDIGVIGLSEFSELTELFPASEAEAVVEEAKDDDSAIFTISARAIIPVKHSDYSQIMLNELAYLLCSKLCGHNPPKPS